MSIVRYRPMSSLLEGFHDELSRCFQPTESGKSLLEFPLAVDIKEENERFLIKADVPEIEPEAIKINAENGTLTIEGERKSEEKKEEKGYRCVERCSGQFLRRFT